MPDFACLPISKDKVNRLLKVLLKKDFHGSMQLRMGFQTEDHFSAGSLGPFAVGLCWVD